MELPRLRGHLDSGRLVAKGVLMGKVFSQEFKDQIVALHWLKGRTCSDLAKEFDLSATTAANWVRAADRSERAEQ